MSPADHSTIDVPQLVAELSEGDRRRVQQLWESYFDRLVKLSENKMPPQLRRSCDGEDLALSALNSFVRGAEQARYPDLQDPAELWSLLVVIAKRKISYRVRSAKRLKRGGGKVRGESVFAAPETEKTSSAVMGLEQFFREEPSVDDVLEIAELTKNLLEKLDGHEFRQVVELKIQGYTHDEIASKLGLSVRTVHRRLLMVRQIWSEMASTAEPDSET